MKASVNNLVNTIKNNKFKLLNALLYFHFYFVLVSLLYFVVYCIVTSELLTRYVDISRLHR